MTVTELRAALNKHKRVRGLSNEALAFDMAATVGRRLSGVAIWKFPNGDTVKPNDSTLSTIQEYLHAKQPQEPVDA
jgi:hypothetical protein